MKNFFLVLIAVVGFAGHVAVAQESQEEIQKRRQAIAEENLLRFQSLADNEYSKIAMAAKRAVGIKTEADEKNAVKVEKFNKLMRFIGYRWNDQRAWEIAGELAGAKDQRDQVDLKKKLLNEQKLRWEAILADVVADENDRYTLVNTLSGDVLFTSMMNRYKTEAARIAKENADAEAKRIADAKKAAQDAEIARVNKEKSDAAAALKAENERIAAEKTAKANRTKDEFATRRERVQAEFDSQLATLTDYVVRRTVERNKNLDRMDDIPLADAKPEKKSNLKTADYKAPSSAPVVMNPNDVKLPALSEDSFAHPVGAKKLRAAQIASILSFLNSSEDNLTGSYATVGTGSVLLIGGAVGFKYAGKNRVGQVASVLSVFAGAGLIGRGVYENMGITRRAARIEALRSSDFGKLVVRSLGEVEAEKLFRGLESGDITEQDLVIKYSDEADSKQLVEWQKEETAKVAASLEDQGQNVLETKEERETRAHNVGSQRAMLRMMMVDDNSRERAKFDAYLRKYDSTVKANTRGMLSQWDSENARRIEETPAESVVTKPVAQGKIIEASHEAK